MWEDGSREAPSYPIGAEVTAQVIGLTSFVSLLSFLDQRTESLIDPIF